jgi:hypothetical protein
VESTADSWICCVALLLLAPWPGCGHAQRQHLRVVTSQRVGSKGSHALQLDALQLEQQMQCALCRTVGAIRPGLRNLSLHNDIQATTGWLTMASKRFIVCRASSALLNIAGHHRGASRGSKP